MPFTLSHAAAVLPFRRTRFPWSALVIGSFGPDFEYFLRMKSGSRAWHFYPDVLIYCLPFTLLTYFAFHLLIRQPVVELLPDSIQARIRPNRNVFPKSLKELVALIGALAIGVGTHLVWDSLTHEYSWPWAHMALLRHRFDLPVRGDVYGFALAQGLSTVLGFLLLAWVFVRWYRETPPQELRSKYAAPRKIGTWLGIVVVAIAGTVWRLLDVWGKQQGWRSGPHPRVLVIIAGVACFLWALLAYGAMMTFWRKGKEAHR